MSSTDKASHSQALVKVRADVLGEPGTARHAFALSGADRRTLNISRSATVTTKVVATDLLGDESTHYLKSQLASVTAQAPPARRR